MVLGFGFKVLGLSYKAWGSLGSFVFRLLGFGSIVLLDVAKIGDI